MKERRGGGYPSGPSVVNYTHVDSPHHYQIPSSTNDSLPIIHPVELKRYASATKLLTNTISYNQTYYNSKTVCTQLHRSPRQSQPHIPTCKWKQDKNPPSQSFIFSRHRGINMFFAILISHTVLLHYSVRIGFDSKCVDSCEPCCLNGSRTCLTLLDQV